mgnify:CR=1 FL=1
MYGPIADFRERLNAGETLIGAGVSLADPLVSDALSDSVDFLWYDQEHSPMSPEVLRAHLTVARTKGRAGIVRVTEGSTPFVKPVLDAGASGVIAPQIRTVEEVRQLVSDCRYPPVGSRGFGPFVPSNYGRDGGAGYVAQANKDIFAAIMLETVEAVEAIDEIVAVPGLDSVMIGPMDLSGSLGVLGNLEHPTVVKSIDKVIDSAKAAGVYVGAGMGLDVEYCITLVRRGVQWVQMASDILAMIEGIDRTTAEVRGSMS